MNLRRFASRANIYTAIFLAALIVLLASGALSYQQIRSLRKTESEVRHSQDIQLSLERLFLTLKDAETGQRGFLITRDSSYLNGYLISNQRITAVLDSLQHMVNGPDRQEKILEELDTLIRRRQQTLSTTLNLAQPLIPISDSLRRNMKKGQNEMDLIRVKIDHMIGNEKSLFDERKSKYQTDIEIQPLIYLFIILFALSIFTFSFYKITTDRLHLQTANERLEKAVIEIGMRNTIFTHAEQSSNTGNFIWRATSGEIVCSDNLLNLLECGPEEKLMTPGQLMTFVNPSDREELSKVVTEVMSIKKITPRILRLVTRSGKSKYFRATGMFTKEGAESVLIATFQDISSDILLKERLQLSHSQLAKTEFRHDQMINEVEDYAIILLDSDGIIEKWNKGAEKIKGYTDEEIIGKSFEVFYPEEDRKRQLPAYLLNQARLHGRASHEGWRLRKDKTRFWGNVIFTALHDEQQNVIGFTKVTRDLTQQKQAEEKHAEYRRSIERKNAELETINNELASFNHIASHDLQEPLRKIQTFISRIVEEHLDPFSERGLEYFNRIRNSANRMQLLIDDLITYSHTRGEKNLVPVSLESMLARILEDMAPRLEDLGAHIETCPLPVVQGIPFQLEQLFSNLIDNSLKYRNPEISTIIKISASFINAADLPTEINPGAIHYHHITFQDNGIGFENQYAESIFTLFRRLHGKTDYTGTGIGLAICKRIVENHNGLITAEGKVNAGATFHIYLPE